MDSYRHHRRATLIGLLAAASLWSISAAWALDISGGTGGQGARLQASELRQMSRDNAVGVKGPKYRYDAVSLCSRGEPGSDNSDVFCTRAVEACQAPSGGPGPGVYVWRRQTSDAAGRPVVGSSWERLGWTCFPDLVPGARNTLTMGHILRQFHDTPFAKPTAAIQPVGLKTLVNLPTYYTATFDPAGYGPGETDTTTILGYRVDIRPRATSYTYHYGDGTTHGPTTNAGGPYPDGQIRHTYTRTDTYPVRIDTTYSAQFRVNGAAWIDIPDTVTIQGTTAQLTVAEAVTRLYQ